MFQVTHRIGARGYLITLELEVHMIVSHVVK